MRPIAAKRPDPRTTRPLLLLQIGLCPPRGQATDARRTGDLISGRYEVIDELRTAGQARLQLAIDHRLGARVVLKWPPPGLGRTNHWRARCEREAELGRLLDHPNVANVHAIVDVDDSPVLVREYVQGRVLAALTGPGSAPIRPARLRRLVGGVLDALAHIHDTGFVHRDLKPSNILVDASDEPKVTDLALATRAGALVSDERTGVPGFPQGTPAYMAPECLLGGPITPATDIYSAGVVLFELITGRHPLGLRNAKATTIRRTILDVDPSLEGMIDMPAVAMVVQTALAKDPADRFSSARVMAGALDDALTIDAPGRGVRRRSVPAEQKERSAHTDHIARGQRG